MNDDIQYPDTPFPLRDSLVLLGWRGSTAHGTYVPNTDPNSIDDRDLYGVVIPPKEYYIGMKTWQHAESIKGVWDIVLDEFKKFVGLLSKQNPNVLGMLWLEPEDYIYIGDSGQALINNRDLFKCKRAAYNSFSGYAHSQLKKMKGGEFKGFMGAKRKQLVEKFGYDTKNAAHLVRLLHMGIEYLETGKLQVRRTTDVDMLKAIKSGEWKLEDVTNYATELESKCRIAYETSDMQEEIDEEKVNQLVMACIEHDLR